MSATHDILHGSVAARGPPGRTHRHDRLGNFCEKGPSVASEPALTTGKVVLRPWRVGIVLDTSDTAAVRDAIQALSGVWGRIYMPLLDVNDYIEKLQEHGAAFDVDSLYSDIDDEDLQKLLRSPDWAWQDYAPCGPLGEITESSIRHGALRWDELADGANHVQPRWTEDDPDELAYAAIFGPPRAESKHRAVTGMSVTEAALDRSRLYPGLIRETANHLRSVGAEYRSPPGGVQVLRSGNTPDRVDSLVSVLGTASLLGHFQHAQEATMSHILGLEVAADGKKDDVDVAVDVPGHEWTVILGEVKTRSRSDENEVLNLECLERRLARAGVQTISLFATMKDDFNDTERSALTARVERSRLLQTLRGDLAASVPLILTGPDLPHSSTSKEHPWPRHNNLQSLLGTTLTSRKRNHDPAGYEYESTNEIEWSWDATEEPAILIGEGLNSSECT